MANDFKEVDRFWPDPATVVPRKEWRIYMRAVATPEGKVMIERVHPAVGETTQEAVFPLDELDEADADRLVAEIIAAKAQIEARKGKKDATKNTNRCRNGAPNSTQEK